MTHEEIERRELAEEYVRGRLSPEERTAFEDHYFACDVCFEKVEFLQKFANGVQDAVRSGRLPSLSATPAWMRPAFYLSAAASLVFATLSGWSLLFERQRLEAELRASRAASQQVAARVEELEKQTESNRLVAANLPLLMLEASRAAEPNAVALTPQTPQLALWMELPPGQAGKGFRLELHPAAGGTPVTVSDLSVNRYGALAAVVPTHALPAGDYKARLFSGAALLAEYPLTIRR